MADFLGVSNLSSALASPADHGLLYDLSVGVGGNLLTALLLIAFLVLVEFGFRRRQLLKFFGFQENRTLRIFIGHIPHERTKGFVGLEESFEAWKLKALFTSLIPGLSDKPGFLRFLHVSDVDVHVEAAGRDNSAVNLSHSVISLGGKSSNYASELIEERLQCPVRVSNQIEIPGLSAITGAAKAVIVRLRRDDKTFFYVAGLDEPSTAAATRFLAKQWRSIRKYYGDSEPFYYLIERIDANETTIIAHNRLVAVAESRPAQGTALSRGATS